MCSECYVHGFMNGEVVDLRKQGELTEEYFDLC